MSNTPHWATILDAIQEGIEGNKDKCRAYAELWLEQLQQDNEQDALIPHLQRILKGERGRLMHLMQGWNEDERRLS